MDAEVHALSRLDIGITPLPAEERAMEKSGGRARTYMAAGVVSVFAAVGYNLPLMEHGRTGFLCRHPLNWVSVIYLLVSGLELRVAVASAARRDVELRFSPVRKAARLAHILIGEAGASRGFDGI